MEDNLVERWNACVSPDDEVYVLGDVFFGTDERRNLELFNKLKGIKYLAIGNHDTDNKIARYKELGLFKDIQYAYRLKKGKVSLFLTHYPTIVGNFDDPKPVYNIHGHTHSPSILGEYPKCYNVSPEANACTPVRLEDVVQKLRDTVRACETCQYALNCLMKITPPFCSKGSDYIKIKYIE